MPYLSPRALEGLKHYQYKPGGYTWLDDLHEPLWKWLTNQLPMWLAPNLITLSGLLMLVGAYVINYAYLPLCKGAAPWWVYFSSAAALIAYTNLDCIDGKQARRTGSSSPLGQMFDHGVDALAVHLVLINLFCTFNAGVSWMSLALLVAIKVPWLLAQWEEYHTGVMLYGNGWWGVLEINYGVAVFHLISAGFGPQIWETRLFNGSSLAAIMGDLDLRGAVVLIIASGAFMQAIGQLMRVCGGAHPCPEQERGNKELGASSRAVQLVEKMTLVVTAIIWLRCSPALATREVLSTFGFIYAWEATQVILAHMTKEPIVTTWWPTAVMALAAANSFVGILDPHLLAMRANVIVIIAYLHYVSSVVREICQALGINCLTIRHHASKLQ